MCFFRDGEYPADRIAGYLHAGLASGGAVAFATPAHLPLLRTALDALGTDVTARVADGQLVLADAERAAESITHDRAAARAAFDERVAGCVEHVIARHGRVRAYGEIVDVLTKSGDASRAVELERWWNDLLRQQPVDLLCGYSMQNFAGAAALPAFRAVCAQHGAIESMATGPHADERGTTGLTQAVAALQTELERRNERARPSGGAPAEAHTAAEHLARLQQFTSALSEATSTEAITQVALSELLGTFRADVALIALAGDDGEQLRLRARGTPRAHAWDGATLRADDSDLPAAVAFRGDRPVWLTTPEECAHAFPQPTAAEPLPEVHATGALPLSVRGRRLGAIAIIYERAVAIPPPMRALIDDYARQVGLALDRALAHDAAQAVRVRLQLLADATACMAMAKLDPRQIIASVARELTRSGFADHCRIEMRSPDGEALYADEGALRGDRALASEVVVPLQTGAEVFGSVRVLRPLGRAPFGLEDKHLVRDLADRAALCVENALLYERSRVERERTERERARAEAANRAKDEFLAMLGHELRNPLSPIRTAVHLMQLRSPGVQARERAIIERQVDHMVRLVDDLLDVSRIARGKVDLKRAPVDLTQIIADAIEIASPLLEERAHELRTFVPPDPLIVYGDQNRLAQVIANLLTNAAKYTPPRGRIEVRATVDAGRVRLSVRDNGNGIEPELMPRLFELFMQGKQEIDRRKGGLGLGLAIARNIVEMHDGTLRAASEGPGKGSEFTLELPLLAAADAGEQAGGAREPTPRTSGRRVLIVDDNTDAADLIADALSSMGHTTQVAYDGPSALQIAGDFRPELALLDIGLPVMDGYELGRRLSKTPGCENVKLVALTGYGQSTDRERSREAGFEEHLVKPIDLERILAVIDRM